MTEFTPDTAHPVLIFGGPYSNLAAVRAMRETGSRLNIPSGNILCTGDIVAYCASPQETTDIICDWGISVVQGNCEESLGNDASDCGCGFDEGSACDLLSTGWFNFAQTRISKDSKRWMAQLPANVSFTYAGLTMRAIHGGLNSINQFIFASDGKQLKEAQLAEAGVDVIIGGHCGIPFGQQLTKGFWLNAGVIGMPANDGRQDTWYMLITAEPEGQVTASWHQLTYDVSHTVSAMQNSGLNTPYVKALQSGYWPSVDILPEAEAGISGQPLKLKPLSLKPLNMEL